MKMWPHLMRHEREFLRELERNKKEIKKEKGGGRRRGQGRVIYIYIYICVWAAQAFLMVPYAHSIFSVFTSSDVHGALQASCLLPSPFFLYVQKENT